MTDATTEGLATLQEKRAIPAHKRDSISAACREHSIESLIRLANSEGGLLDDAFRTTACESFVWLRTFKDLNRFSRASSTGLR